MLLALSIGRVEKEADREYWPFMPGQKHIDQPPVQGQRAMATLGISAILVVAGMMLMAWASMMTSPSPAKLHEVAVVQSEVALVRHVSYYPGATLGRVGAGFF